MIQSRLISLLVFLVVLVGLTACGGGGSSKSTTYNDTSTKSLNQTTQTVRSQTVTSPDLATGSISLEWAAPVAREDGTPLQLSDIGGFRIYYGETRGNYTSYIDVPDGTAQSVTLRDLPVGTYYLAMTTYDINGLESDLSSSVMKTAA